MRHFLRYLIGSAFALATLSTSAQTVRVGVMLPLHDDNGDGKRMVEYYRGILLACDQLKREGISTDIHAWNVPEGADIKPTLLQEGADKCDLIFGPLYTSQVKDLGNFAKAYNAKVVIPFSISSDEVKSNPQVFQIFQSQEDLDKAAIAQFLFRYKDYHPIFIDCNDKETTKGAFTAELRKQLEKKKIEYNITNLNSPEESFVRAFRLDKPNMVILNSARSPELTKALDKLDQLTQKNGSVQVSLFGYNEWLMYEKLNLERYYKYDTFVPSYYYYNIVSSKTQQLEQDYRRWFHVSMNNNYLPRFALTGYDHAMFFIKGIAKEGKNFRGTEPNKDALQTRLRFEPASRKGGMQNKNFMLVHYNRNRSISTIAF